MKLEFTMRDMITYPKVTQQLDYGDNGNKKTNPYLMKDPIEEVHNSNWT